MPVPVRLTAILTVERSEPGNPLRDAWVADTIRTREGNSCRLTGKQGSWRDPLAVYPILTLPDASLERLGNLPPPLEEILFAFLGEDVAAWACAGCKLESPLAGHWLVLKSAAETFAQGFWRVEPMEGYPSKVGSDPVPIRRAPIWCSCVNWY